MNVRRLLSIVFSMFVRRYLSVRRISVCCCPSVLFVRQTLFHFDCPSFPSVSFCPLMFVRPFSLFNIVLMITLHPDRAAMFANCEIVASPRITAGLITSAVHYFAKTRTVSSDLLPKLSFWALRSFTSDSYLSQRFCNLSCCATSLVGPKLVLWNRYNHKVDYRTWDIYLIFTVNCHQVLKAYPSLYRVFQKHLQFETSVTF